MNKNNIEIGQKVGFIGCGKMASAIIKGILSSNFLTKDQIVASEVNEDFANAKKSELGIEVFTNNNDVAKFADVIFLATKPNYIREVLQGISKDLNENKLVVSIAAGVSTKSIELAIGKKVPVIRVMPNAPAMILEGISGIVKGEFATEEHIKTVEELLSNIGRCIIVEESQIDVLTAISGSGPAFFYKTINEIARAGEKLGLDYKKALLLSIQTAIGSAKLMLDNDLTPEELIANIATKGGCTQVGVDFMESANSKDLFFETIKKTAEKAKALGN